MENEVHIAGFLSRKVRPREKVAFGEMGLTPYLTPELYYVDVHGLVDHNIARLKTMRRNIGITDDYTDGASITGRYLIATHPDYVAQWAPARYAFRPILNDHYVPFAEERLPYRVGGQQTKDALWVIRLWKVADATRELKPIAYSTEREH